MDELPSPAEPDFLANLNITDRASGMTRARTARDRLLAAGKHVLGSTSDYTVELLVFSGLLARAQGFHEGAVAAIEAGNPYAAFILIGGYAENAAAILYLKDRPGVLGLFGGTRITPASRWEGMTNHAEKRFAGFKPIYRQLSQIAHSRCAISLNFTLGRARRRKNDPMEFGVLVQVRRDAMIACAWVVEPAEASAYLLVELAAGWANQPSLLRADQGRDLNP